jgi:hypothetical protein
MRPGEWKFLRYAGSVQMQEVLSESGNYYLHGSAFGFKTN